MSGDKLIETKQCFELILKNQLNYKPRRHSG